jgi:soluble lytic murein transglycosylase
MSSMTRATSLFLVVLGSLGVAFAAVPAMAEEDRSWDEARARAMAGERGEISRAVDRWEVLNASDGRLGFADYAGFLMAWPGFPEEAKMRGWAEAALARDAADAQRIVAFFDRFVPATNPARAHYALALRALNRPEATRQALAAWRGGPMSDAAEATIFATYAGEITQADHDERMDALLWAGAAGQAQRQILYVSAGARGDFLARLAFLNGQDPATIGAAPSAGAMRDPGFVFNRVRQLRTSGNGLAAAQVLASRPVAARPPRDETRWVGELLAVARRGDAFNAARIAAGIDDAFAPGTDISRLSFRLRDDYTSLMWLGGTQALRNLGDGRMAAPLFWRYGNAARTPYTRAKGFYWAGRAAALAGDRDQASRHFELAAQYADTFYGQLSLERLGRPMPDMNSQPAGTITAQERAAFAASPLARAVREVARGHEWRTTIRFFREIAEQAEGPGGHLLVAELARETGRRDLAVILGQQAHTDGLGNFHSISFPTMPITPGADWTMVHAITRQESQFAMNAISHAGARGLMQLMPGTAAEQARLEGLTYDRDALTRDAAYNIQLGNGYFRRMMDYYNGSYPLAVAAYNAGPGNVNKWLRANGDPRRGTIDWVDWIERIPVTETRNYVQRVLENAVVYEAMFPARARYRGTAPVSHFLGKPNPG